MIGRGAITAEISKWETTSTAKNWMSICRPSYNETCLSLMWGERRNKGRAEGAIALLGLMGDLFQVFDCHLNTYPILSDRRRASLFLSPAAKYAAFSNAIKSSEVTRFPITRVSIPSWPLTLDHQCL